jgi:hypothetical protein
MIRRTHGRHTPPVPPIFEPFFRSDPVVAG